jgi:hypothetical protein
MESSTPHSAANDSGDDCGVTVPQLPLLEDDSVFEVETNGYDPYNSGSFDSAKWRTEK